MSTLILASASPRRSQLLHQVGLAHRIHTVDIDELWREQESLEEYVARLAREKARACPVEPGCVILAADTAGTIGSERLVKPTCFEHARTMLRAMSNRQHTVATALCVYQPDSGRIRSKVVSSTIEFIALSDADIERYWATGEPQDKAGAYAIQGLAAAWVKRIEGSYSAIVGLPLAETVALLQEFGIAAWQATTAQDLNT